MLVRFEVSNFRSIAEAVELSLVAVDQDRPAARAAERLGESVLTRAAIYGPNASGKSNVLAALAWLSGAVRQSLVRWDESIPVDPFAFGQWRDKPTAFTVDYLVDGVRFEYVLELGSDRVHRELLYHHPMGRPRMIFEREGDSVKFGSSMGSVPPVDELLTPTALLLSLARQFKIRAAADFARQLGWIGTFGALPGSGVRRPMTSTTGIFDTEHEDYEFIYEKGEREEALGLLRLADLGISEVLVEREERPMPANRDGKILRSTPRTGVRTVVRLVHGHGDDQVAFGMDDESQGTRTWYAMIGPLISALRRGTPIIFDELDASLHPVLSAELLRIFADESTNPRGAQLIFSTHDTSLLGHLNRDEVWLTEKRQDGSTELGALAEFAGERVRKAMNLESAYLHGRFGAIPDVNRMEFLRSLGLVG